MSEEIDLKKMKKDRRIGDLQYLWFNIFEHGGRRLCVEGAALALVRDDGLEELRAVVQISLKGAPQKHLMDTNLVEYLS